MSAGGLERVSGPGRWFLPVRVATARHRLSPDGWAMVIVVGAVVGANLPYLLDLFDPNPLGPRGGLAAALTPGVLRGQPAIDPNYGFISQALSHRAALDLIHLHVPWWNPYEGTGAPLVAEMQSAALFPPTLLALLSNGQLYEHMLFEMVAGLSTYLLLRRLEIGRWASTGGAIAFALNGAFAWFAHAPVNPIPFLPLLLLGIEHAYSASLAGRRGGWWLIAVAGALSIYAGFYEVTYVNGVFAVFWLAWRFAGAGRARVLGLARKAVTGAVVGALLAAPLLIASIDYVSQGELGINGTGYLGTVHLSSQALPQLVLPYVYGPILGYSDPKLVAFGIWVNVGGYLTTSLVMLGLLGLTGRGRRGLKVALLAWLLLALTRMYGQPHFLGQILGVLPGMSRVAFFRYASASVSLAVVVLAALGIDALASLRPRSRRLLWVTLASLAVVAGAAIGARSLVDHLGATFGRRPYFPGSVAWGAAVVIAIAAAALIRGRGRRGQVAAVIVAVDAIALFAVPELSAPREVRTDLAPVAFLRQHLGTARFFTLGPLQPNYGSYFGLASLNINDLPIPSVFDRYTHQRLDQVVNPTVLVGNYGGGRPVFAPSPTQELLSNLAGYRAASVRYVLTPAGQALPQSRATFTLVDRTPTAWIYRLAGSAPYFTATDRRCRLAFASRTSVRAACPGSSVLIRRETDLPGWSAAVDGHAVPIRRTGGLFQAVAVGPGTHRVEFGYAPRYVGWGILAFAAGCGCLLAGALAGRFKLPGRRRP